MPDYQSAVRSALAADDGVHGKRAEVGWTELEGARLQHLVPTIARQTHLKDAAERGHKTLSVAIPFGGSSGPLHLLIDATGLKVEGEGEWNARKHPSHTCKHVLPGSGWL